MRLPRLRFTVRLSMLLILLVGLAIGWLVFRAREASGSRGRRTEAWRVPSSKKGLYELNLDGTKVTDAGLIHVNGLTGLQYLHLNDTQLTDAGIDQLKGLTGLKMLWLDRTRVTHVGIAGLQKALPSTKISWGH